MKIAFIINPVSGVKKKSKIEHLILSSFCNPEYDVTIHKTEYHGHATELARNLASQGVDTVVAVGGDGTLNEVSAGLLKSGTVLGLIPCGSGDGLARHLNISKNPAKAIKLILARRIYDIDMVFINNTSFINVAGIGYDAQVAHAFAKCTRRGFWSYIKQILNIYFSYTSFESSISCNNKTIERTAYLIEFANSSQFGNNAVISPMSLTNDQLIEICILKPFPWYYIPNILTRLYTKTMHNSKFMEIIQSGNILVKTKQPVPAHIDGEPLCYNTEFNVKIYPNALKIIY